MKKKYKKIYCCGECVNYNFKKHECRIGAKEEGTARDSFYLDCPLKTFEEDEEEIGEKTTPRPAIYEITNKIPCNTHELKILPKWFEDVQANKKNFEIRKNDRNFELGDYLILKEWYGGKFTDRYIIRQIEYIYQGDGRYGISEDCCVLGLKVPQAVMIQNGNNVFVGGK